MEKLKIVGWTNFECDLPSRSYSAEEMNEIISLVSEEIIRNQYFFGGEDHQNASTGVPVLSDGTCFRASMRCWGHLMASIYQRPDGSEFTYMDFYMSLGDQAILPKSSIIDVEPTKVEEENYGSIVNEDIKLLSETMSMGVSLMTTDKVLLKYIEMLQKEKRKTNNEKDNFGL